MDLAEHNNILSKIYASRSDLSIWQDIIVSLSNVSGFDGGMMINIVSDSVYVVSSHPFYNDLSAFYKPGPESADIRFRRYLEKNATGFVPDSMLCTTAELHRTDVYKLLLKPNRIHTSAVSILNLPNDALVAFAFDMKCRNCETKASSIAYLDAMHGHLKAAIQSTYERKENEIDCVLLYMDAQAQAMATIDAGGNIVKRNHAFQSTVSKYATHVMELAGTAHAETRTEIEKAVSVLSEGSGFAPVRIPLFDSYKRDYTIMTMTPSRPDPGDIFHSPFAYIHFARGPLTGDELVRINALQFNLTKTEAQIAIALLAAEAPADIAARTSVSIATVRTHIRNIFAKTGSHRQSELISKLYKS